MDHLLLKLGLLSHFFLGCHGYSTYQTYWSASTMSTALSNYSLFKLAISSSLPPQSFSSTNLALAWQ